MQLHERVAFDSETKTADGLGGYAVTWAQQFETRAHYIQMRGGEKVIAARLEGVHPMVVRLRRCTAALAVTHDWRMRDVRTGDVYQVRDVTPTTDRRWIDVLVERGVTQ
jgi:head-tail adaptor